MITINILKKCEDGDIGVALEVSSSTILPPEIFLLRSEDDSWEGVASLSGVVKDWPPYKEVGKNFYRVSKVERSFQSIEENDNFVSSVLDYVTSLQRDYSRYLEDGNYNQEVTVEI